MVILDKAGCQENLSPQRDEDHERAAGIFRDAAGQPHAEPQGKARARSDTRVAASGEEY
jgi:hypothetical protein